MHRESQDATSEKSRTIPRQDSSAPITVSRVSANTWEVPASRCPLGATTTTSPSVLVAISNSALTSLAHPDRRRCDTSGLFAAVCGKAAGCGIGRSGIPAATLALAAGSNRAEATLRRFVSPPVHPIVEDCHFCTPGKPDWVTFVPNLSAFYSPAAITEGLFRHELLGDVRDFHPVALSHFAQFLERLLRGEPARVREVPLGLVDDRACRHRPAHVHGLPQRGGIPAEAAQGGDHMLGEHGERQHHGVRGEAVPPAGVDTERQNLTVEIARISDRRVVPALDGHTGILRPPLIPQNVRHHDSVTFPNR